jgi:hypothetical protein
MMQSAAQGYAGNEETPPQAGEKVMPHVQEQLSEDNLWREVLEEASEKTEINTSYVTRMYRETVQEKPLLRLVQDVHERIAVYHNILEELKTGARDEPTSPAAGGQGTVAQQIRARYEGLKLVPEGKLPNPFPWEIVEYVKRKLRKYSALLLDLMATHTEEIVGEMKMTHKSTVVFQVQIGWPPSLTVGIEHDRK